MWTRQQLKANARASLRRFHWYGVLVCLIVYMLCGTFDTGIELNLNFTEIDFGSSLLGQLNGSIEGEGIFGYLFRVSASVAWIVAGIASLVSLAFAWFVSNVVEIGGHRYFLSARERATPISVLFDGFHTNYRGIVIAMMLRSVLIFLWSLLFLVPGLIKGYAYRMVLYLLAENPNMDYRRALSLSEEMMRGHKFETFVFDLSFLGWEILSVITNDLLGILYVKPYLAAAHTEHYCAVRAEAFAHGLTDTNELPGFSDNLNA